ncbi:60S ribosomal protein L7 [Culex quinquefasciatus]|uniref:60S ribosomal protein L7 n=1 Tax=Culex quinquefasciatus TaxID=7176 RepID=B0W7H3_CULQU|nr:60S ribosomal protein L7 [Culex quinquefasciatus]|eukprot:XP_001844657.1 60S ribosomal protein L7 [Culex quinquefasciatus]
MEVSLHKIDKSVEVCKTPHYARHGTVAQYKQNSNKILIRKLPSPAVGRGCCSGVKLPADVLLRSAVLLAEYSDIILRCYADRTASAHFERNLEAGNRLRSKESLKLPAVPESKLKATKAKCCVPRTSLNTPTCDWRKYNHYGEDGDFGNRKEKINELIKRMVYLRERQLDQLSNVQQITLLKTLLLNSNFCVNEPLDGNNHRRRHN